MTTTPHVMIIGGGITGLTSAYYLQKQLKQDGRNAHISVVEQSGSFGGKIRTLERDGFIIEKGPDSFLARKRAIIDLTRDLGLEHELRGQNPKAKKTYILHHGKLHRMPQGLVLGIPTAWTPFMKTGLISPLGKIRAAMDTLLPKREDKSDESLGHFLERRLGKEVLEHIAEPLLAGIYAGDTHALSLQATFPQFKEMEQNKRSLILGMMANNNNKTTAENTDLPPAAQNSIFLTYKKGLQTLVNALVEALAEADLRTGESVKAIHRLENRVEVLFEDGHSEIVDGVILTAPAYQAAKLLAHLPASEKLKKINYVSVANVIMAFDLKDIPMTMDGSGFLIPRKEARTITACTWTSAKWQHTAPVGKVLLRCYVGRSGEEDWVNWDDQELVRRVRKDIADLMGIHAEPQFAEITRMPHSMPQYPVDHLDMVAEFRSKLAEAIPGVYVTGAGFHGVGIPDCIRQGEEASQQLTRYLQQTAGISEPVYMG
jgi:protoporphyrinogen/coproporphyrinogen III oxidase